ncbi:bifunctional D-glycero-beta-D-manno-heptose-7-phosphate kinase/D-glycero-beta-D-manno-heptose 1-phosphate adenylyltransferase HldE [Celerinatantimonas diazotrophica]|uniref:Bifunctional protein HldE n=1 Tax=Celerinatantimonas diazotrophica TaxID=412034 RepID=A0A4R1J9C6_9GAMM|nr:bifunctional D-glycero-beta-D-manno-heptose-7-phosphate kinase/D-glycero-beta-D-manno-heptose 1-phosphate adenylyltransferase HldE [Celerinatantimonas diazotrophica]TCK47017.1 D-alpha,beta-D-heptose 7-phosphate 1-kinase /D-beta-D-heptose 1-phosphate adenylyltransferase [Celerinatantimonas diazotrophica]CAG9295785.1 Bifunctional protein HldE [Celerinatantimonas diazotrophica]
MQVDLPEYAPAKVLVVGDVMLDRYWHGGTGRISPEAPVPVVNVKRNEERPGGAANVALNVVALGAKSTLLGMTGNDEAADSLDNILSQVGVCCDFAKFDDYPTITKLRVMSRHQQLIRLDFEESFHGVDAAELIAKFKSHLSCHQVVILSDYNKGALAQVKALLSAAKQSNIPVLVDPKGTDFSRYYGATLLTPNFSEFEAVVGPCQSEQEIADKGFALIEKLALQALLVTRSEHGMTLLEPGKKPLNLPAQAKEVFDVTGAGDTVIATLGASLSAGQSLAQSCALANAAASIVVGKMGTSTVSAQELAKFIYGGNDSGYGVISQLQLQEAIQIAHSRGEKVVMTNGCFDILHAGHVSYLSKAKSLGDRLIVAVNDDESVRRLKGSTRPINPLERRMAVLAGLAAVDWVVSFSDDTPQQLIADLLPDLLVKGGDYQVEQIAGHKEVLANGGDVKVLNFEDGCSTSKIIEAIKKTGKNE